MPFHDDLCHFVFLFFSTARLAAHALYIIQDDTVEGLEGFLISLTNNGLILDQ